MAMEISSTVATYQEAPRVQKVIQTSQTPTVTSEVVTPDVKVVRSVTNGKREDGNNRNAKDGEGNQNEGFVNEKKLKNAVSRMNSHMRMSKNKCEFSYHEKTKRVSIKVVDEETSEVIREIPPEEALEMFEKMLEIAGLLVDEKR